MTENILGVGSRVKHPAYGDGVITYVDVAAYKVTFISFGVKLVGREYKGWEIVEALPYDDEQSFALAEKSLIRILRMYNGLQDDVPLGDKWKNGTMILQPEDESLKGKDIPIETFFHKIVMVRDRIRVMEQRINASGLSDEEKVNLQQYITKIYGSLTTFNMLFKNKEDQFTGEKS